ncbi:MAG TPA: TraR/DksA C4-type zinc finger protein [Longimicrobiaceae bacterium]|nr:TraR/DksA C4-type zinc finger protein [Longimicrobiaceae bacterium]
MTTAQLHHIERLLLRERGRILRSLDQLRPPASEAERAEGEGGFGRPLHPASLATSAIAHEQTLALAERERRYLSRIDEALERLNEDPDGFGRCQACGREIPLTRLEFVPHSRYCLECKARIGEEG